MFQTSVLSESIQVKMQAAKPKYNPSNHKFNSSNPSHLRNTKTQSNKTTNIQNTTQKTSKASTIAKAHLNQTHTANHPKTTALNH